MSRPRLYVCYGMPKSGSTLAYRLSFVVAQRAGFDQSPLAQKKLKGEGQFERLLDLAAEQDRRMVVIKTHAAPSDALRDAVKDGRVLVQTHARDPRDVALSMRDAGTHGAEWGKMDSGVLIREPEDALVRLRRNVWRHGQWSKLPGALSLNYEETAFSTIVAARRIAEHMGIKAAPRRDALAAKRGFTQLNKGRSQRHLTEMDAAQQQRWYAEFREHIDTYCPPHTGPVWPAKVGTVLGRALRKLS